LHRVESLVTLNREFHGFGQAKFVKGGLISGLNQFTLLPQLPLKIMPDFKSGQN